MKIPGVIRWDVPGVEMWLLPAKALWWPAESMLVVSDLHLAKAEHFRSQGLAVPPTVDFQTLSVLTSSLKACRPKTLVLLGDLFHSSPNRAWEDFEAWLQDEKAAGLETGILVRGNHDRAHDVVYEAMGLDVVDMWEKQGVVLTHEPDDDIPKGTRIHLCGHVHPAAVMRGVGRQSERVPCYAQSSTGCEAGYRLTLPAFGAFTGMHAVEPKRGEEVYLVTEREVIGPVRSMPSRKGFSRRGRR